jgi:zinc D-Ala-D-Ala dipeptidase
MARSVRRVLWLALAILSTAAATHSQESTPLPPGFVDLATALPELAFDLRYGGNHNFLGAVVTGYERPRAVISAPAAAALARAQKALAPFGLGLMIYDAYRPQRAVDHFVRWANDLNDQRMKAEFYPNIDKSKLFELGYIAEKSGHSRGSTVDLTLISLSDQKPLDLGSPYDLFDPISWPQSAAISASARAHRLLLRAVLVEQGFRPYEQEWWHFTLNDEPFPTTYFDFPLN